MSFFKSLGKQKCTFKFTIRIHGAEHLTSEAEFSEQPRVFCKCKRKGKIFQTRQVDLTSGEAVWDEDIVFGATLLYSKKNGFSRKIFIFSIETPLKELDYSSSLDVAKFVQKGACASKTKTLLLYPSGSLKMTITAAEVIDGVVAGSPSDKSQEFFFKPGQDKDKQKRVSVSANAGSVFDIPSSAAGSSAGSMPGSRKASISYSANHAIPDDEKVKVVIPMKHVNFPSQPEGGLDHKHVEMADDYEDSSSAMDRPFNKQKYTDIVSNMLGHMKEEPQQSPVKPGRPKSFRRSFTRVMKEINSLPEVEKKIASSEAYRAAMAYFKSYRSPSGKSRSQANNSNVIEEASADNDNNYRSNDNNDNNDNTSESAPSARVSSDAQQEDVPFQSDVLNVQSLTDDEFQPGSTPSVSVPSSARRDEDLRIRRVPSEDRLSNRSANTEDLEREAALHAEAIISILKEEYEVRVVWSTKEVPFGFIEATPMHTLKAARAHILEELDHVPKDFYFLEDGKKFPKAEEADTMIIDVYPGDILRISTTRAASREQSRRRAERALVSALERGDELKSKQKSEQRGRAGSARKSSKYAHVQSRINTGLKARPRRAETDLDSR